MKYSGQLSLIDRIKILTHGYGASSVTFILIAIILLFLGFGAMVLLKPYIAHRLEQLASQSDNVSSRNSATKRITKTWLKRNSYVPGYMRAPAEDDEYTKLLRYFDLEDGASESEIKKAYRNKVKNLHPDAKPGEVNTEDAAFIELKEVHDRLLEMRKSMFGVKR